MDNLKLQRINAQLLQNTIIKKQQSSNDGNSSFENMLNMKNNETNGIKFSKHAQERMETRRIKLNNTEISKIENAIYKAEVKGIKEALILMGDKAFIASIKSKTIITTANAEQLKESIFTNIDGAVVI